MRMDEQEQIYSYRVTRSVRTGGNSIVACILILAGVAAFIFTSWIIGLVLIIIGAACDTKKKRVAHCGNCGNTVALTSILCPTCHADLAPPPPSKFKAAAVTVLILALMIFAAWLTIKALY